jgi:hypothetical protein
VHGADTGPGAIERAKGACQCRYDGGS